MADDYPPHGDRILIVGDTNAGKSTLGAQLGEALLNRRSSSSMRSTGSPAGRHAIARTSAACSVSDCQKPDAGSLPETTVPAPTSTGAAPTRSSGSTTRCPSRCRVLSAATWRRWRDKEVLWGTNTEHITDQLMLWDQNRSLISFSVRNHRRRRRGLEAAMNGGRLDRNVHPSPPAAGDTQPVARPRHRIKTAITQ